MSRLEVSVCVLLFSVFISSVSQILLKKAAQPYLRNPSERISESTGSGCIWAVLLFCDPDNAGTEICAFIHVTDPGIHRLYFCFCYGVYFSEGKIYQKKTLWICPDPGMG